ncbi:MAG: esterase/lipase family protein [Myxococcaceae bacterium]
MTIDRVLKSQLQKVATQAEKAVAKPVNAVKAEINKGHSLLDKFHLDFPKLPHLEGPKPDPFNTVKDWASDKAFNALRPNKKVSEMSAPQRVAYGEINAPPVLKRPVVMIPGLTMPAKSFNAMGEGLAKNPQNGKVAVYVAEEGKFRLGGVHGQELSEAEAAKMKIFEVEYKDPWASPTKKAPQIAQALDAISKVTGQKDVDVVTHSAGGTDFRLYLDQRDASKGPHINRTVMIGPASHGTYLGNIGAVVGQPVKNVDDAARELAVGSKMINDLNADWDKQRGQIAGGVTIIGTTGTPTLGPAKGVFEDGDGYMPAAQLAMPGAKVVTMEGPHNTPLAHLWQVQYSGVVNAAFDALK